MLGPLTLIADSSLQSDADGTTARKYYFDIPFAALAKALFVEYKATLPANAAVDFEIEDSVSGETWDSTGQGWSQVTSSGADVLRSASTFATKARLRVTVSGTSGTTAKTAQLRVFVSGKPF